MLKNKQTVLQTTALTKSVAKRGTVTGATTNGLLKAATEPTALEALLLPLAATLWL